VESDSRRESAITESVSDTPARLALDPLPPIEAFVNLLEQVAPNVSVPLEFLGGLEPDLAVLLIERLGQVPSRPGLHHLLQTLAHCSDSRLRMAAASALQEQVVRFCVNGSLAAGKSSPASVLAVRHATPAVRGLVTAMDGLGRAQIGLLAEVNGVWVAAVFDCDVELGVVRVAGFEGPDRLTISQELENNLRSDSLNLRDGEPALAIELLRAVLTQAGPGSPPDLAYWVERVCGKGLTPSPLRSPVPLRPADHDSPRSMAQHAVKLLDALPGWWEDDPLTDSLASESVVRVADPGNDPGAVRILFERRLVHRLERYSRMLTWMGIYWYIENELQFSQLAFEFAAQLDDPQNAVPRHPWIAEYARRSLRQAGQRQVNAVRQEYGLSPKKGPGE